MPTSKPDLDRGLHAISDPVRRRILQALKERKPAAAGRSGLCAGDVEECVRLSQPTVSHHMAILTKAGLVNAVKQGQWRWYSRNEAAIRVLIKTLRSKL